MFFINIRNNTIYLLIVYLSKIFEFKLKKYKFYYKDYNLNLCIFVFIMIGRLVCIKMTQENLIET